MVLQVRAVIFLTSSFDLVSIQRPMMQISKDLDASYCLISIHALRYTFLFLPE